MHLLYMSIIGYLTKYSHSIITGGIDQFPSVGNRFVQLQTRNKTIGKD